MRRPLGPFALAPVLLLVLGGCGQGPVASDPAPDVPSTSSGQPDDTTAEPPTDAPTDMPTDQPTDQPSDQLTDQPTDVPTKSPPLTPGGVPHELLEIVSGTAGQGRVSPSAVPIASEADADAFVAGLSDELAGEVLTALRGALARSGDGVHAAVVAVGCDVPPGVTVTRTTAGYQVAGLKVADPLPNCFAPVTSVAVVDIPG